MSDANLGKLQSLRWCANLYLETSSKDAETTPEKWTLAPLKLLLIKLLLSWCSPLLSLFGFQKMSHPRRKATVEGSPSRMYSSLTPTCFVSNRGEATSRPCRAGPQNSFVA
ncbi:hypothetical protein AcV5_005567 [Taiwanofungus camphoratus]|nr:hypothetical protein AcV5_005567 [Antrodia cinnamomea]